MCGYTLLLSISFGLYFNFWLIKAQILTIYEKHKRKKLISKKKWLYRVETNCTVLETKHDSHVAYIT